ncbi:MAG: hypothetical protein A4E35_01312 [Methanoregula sp. PtaU1.Bin051]|nr:MAG: hypothetical protein A4E35_01312 [Methanoregula sp. PtaU1.Bin051]
MAVSDDWIVVISGVVVVVCVICATLVALRRQERRMFEGRYKMQVYSDLLHAVTELNLAGEDPYKLEKAKKDLAYTVNRLNLVASPGVLKSTNDLLDFLSEHMGKDFDALRLHNILNTLVIEARRDVNPGHAKSMEEAQVRFRFFTPIKK